MGYLHLCVLLGNDTSEDPGVRHQQTPPSLLAIPFGSNIGSLSMSVLIAALGSSVRNLHSREDRLCTCVQSSYRLWRDVDSFKGKVMDLKVMRVQCSLEWMGRPR